MSLTHWLINAPNGTDFGEIYYSSQCMCYVYNQPIDISITTTGLKEIVDFMKQL